MDHIDEVYHENYKTMLCVAHKMLGNGYDANDIAQDVFIDFFEKCQGGTPVKYPKSWLYRVTLNKCADWLRKNKRHKSIEDVHEKAGPDDQGENRERKAIVGKALSTLKTNERAMAVLYSEGLSYREIAEVTGINPASTGKMLSRILKKVESELKRLGYEMH
ncbi:MAG: sigma-70 family RNA polymerase sigma factor [Marinilabilia sp.]